MQFGVDRFDASIAGLGGGVVLPDALAGVGNTPTEDLVQMMVQMGVETGVDPDRAEAVAFEISDRLDVGQTSHVLMGGTIDNVLSTVAEENR
jgi:hydroxymethylglutaryl-CoA lyase